VIEMSVFDKCLTDKRMANIFASLEDRAKRVVASLDRLDRLTSRTIFLVGKELIEARKQLARHGSGVFNSWCTTRLGFGRTTAYKWRKVVEAFGDCSHCERFIDPSALYLLSAETTPVRAREIAQARARKGIRIKAATAKSLIYSVRQREHVKVLKPYTTDPDLADRTELEDLKNACQAYYSRLDVALPDDRKDFLKWRRYFLRQRLRRQKAAEAKMPKPEGGRVLGVNKRWRVRARSPRWG
jgi:hypothetical protein